MLIQFPKLQTYLSSYVLSIWSEFNATDSLTVEMEALSIDGLTINVDFAGLKSLSSIITGSDCNDNAYKEATRLIAPIGHSVFTSYSQLEADKLTEYLRWTQNEKVFLNSLRELQRGDINSVGPCLLRCTAVLERALGNLFMLQSYGTKQVPSMMKDLLASNELSEVFGTAVMSLLQLVVGPPKSLNVRNIVWHGFAAPQEMPSKFGYLIIGLTATLGRILREKKEDLYKSDHRRQQISLNDGSVDVLDEILPDVIGSVNGISYLKKIFQRSPFIPKLMLSYWTEALDRIQEHKYGDAIVLVLPQLEHSLRCLYATINECPERLLTAQSTEFYTTFDEILARNMNNETESNKLIEYLGDKIIAGIQDVLVFPDGPRLRDRLSHGELVVETIPRVLANHILGLALYFATLFLNDEEINCLETEVGEVRKAVLNYKPVFHPFSITSRMIVDVYDRCNGPHRIKHLSEVDNREQVSTHLEMANLVIARNTLDGDSIMIMRKIFDGTAGHIEIKQWLREMWGQFLHRPRIEWEVLGSLRRSMADVVAVVEQVEIALETRSRMLEDHRLRSRQRATYLRMVKIIPMILVCLRLLIIVICGYMLNINSCELWSDEKQEIERRLLRVIEKYAQNLKSLTSSEKNRWDETKSITSQFLNKLLIHYTKLECTNLIKTE